MLKGMMIFPGRPRLDMHCQFRDSDNVLKPQDVREETGSISNDFMIDFLDSPLATLLATKTERSFNCPGNCQK